MQIRLNDQTIRLEKEETLGTLLESSGILPGPALSSEEMEWIHNPDCPLLYILEIDGMIVPFAIARHRPLREGMTILTDSPRLRDLWQTRLRQLHERDECALIRELQELIAVEAELSGFVDRKVRATWRYDARTMSPSIFHDPNLCVRCQSCIEICREVQAVEALAYDEAEGIRIDEERCTRCGQCIHACPMGFQEPMQAFRSWMGCEVCPFARPRGAMREIEDIRKVWAVLHDPDRYVVVEFAPSVRATIGEEFGCPPGTLMTGQLYAALRRMGFHKVWDTNFSADLTIMEEGTELLHRLKEGGVFPMLTSCSPGWIRYIETFFPTLLPHLSTAKSPQQMFGAVAKTYAARALGIDPRRMAVVSIMPCTAKKFEATRPEMTTAAVYWREHRIPDASFPDVDFVLTTRELGRLLKMAGIDLASLPEEAADPLLGSYTGAATIFGRTGGVMEAALRTAYELLTGTPLEALTFEDLGTLEGIKKAEIRIGEQRIRVAVANGLANAKAVCESIRDDGEFARYHFIEIMACPGGCIGGGGQPIPTNRTVLASRCTGLNRDDAEVCAIRRSHENPEIQKIYADFLGSPCSELSHHLLHTTYTDRSKKEGVR